MKICFACEKSYEAEAWRCSLGGADALEVDGFLSFAPALSQSNDGFSADYFAQLSTLETGHFWFRSRNRILQWAFGKCVANARSFLEIGCGTGFVLTGLRERFPHLLLAGSEIFTNGLRYAQARLPVVSLFQMDARKLPFDGEFDVIGAFDVLEHIDEDEQVLAEMFRSCRPGGGVLITVPQHRSLWSAVDDYACHKRRYSRAELVSKVTRAGFEVTLVTSFVSLLLPLFAVSRWRRSRPDATFDPLAEYRIGRLTNGVLESVLTVERSLITSGVSLPAGGSLLLAAVKH